MTERCPYLRLVGNTVMQCVGIAGHDQKPPCSGTEIPGWPGLKAPATLTFSELLERAQHIVANDIGDKFYEPQSAFGEFDLPENIAINAIAHALAKQAQELGATVVIDADDLPETDTDEEDEANEMDEEEADAAAAYAMG